MKHKTFLICSGALSTWHSKPTFSMKFWCNLRRNFFGFFLSSLWKTWLVHSNFSWFPEPTIHLQYEDFASYSKNQPFWNVFSLTPSSKNRSRFSQRTKMVLQRTEKLFFERQQNWHSLQLLSSVYYQLASHFKVSIHENFFSLYLDALSRE